MWECVRVEGKGLVKDLPFKESCSILECVRGSWLVVDIGGVAYFISFWALFIKRL